MRIASFVGTLAVTVTALYAADAAFAATCREELREFERKLSESSLAIERPESFTTLSRAAADAAELRDEDLCLQQVAELNAALAAADPGPQPVSDADTEASTETTDMAPPAAPVLLEAAPVEYQVETSVDPEGEQPDNESTE